MRKLRRDEEGIALPVAISILAIVLLLVGVAVAYSVHSLDRSNHDRASARALAAADAGLDVAGYRMNKTLVGEPVTGLIALGSGVTNLLTRGCIGVNVTAGGLPVNFSVNLGASGGGWCVQSSVAEVVDDQGGTTSRERFQYYTNYGIGLGVLNGSLLTVNRKVVSVGQANGRIRRVVGTYQLTGNPNNDTTLLNFKLTRYAECPSLQAINPAQPDAGCPS